MSMLHALIIHIHSVIGKVMKTLKCNICPSTQKVFVYEKKNQFAYLDRYTVCLTSNRNLVIDYNFNNNGHIAEIFSTYMDFCLMR